MLSDDIERVRRALESFYSKKDEVWVSFGRIKTALAELQNTDTQHTQAKMPSWCDVTKGVTFSTVGECDVAAEVFSRVARHFGCA